MEAQAIIDRNHAKKMCIVKTSFAFRFFYCIFGGFLPLLLTGCKGHVISRSVMMCLPLLSHCLLIRKGFVYSLVCLPSVVRSAVVAYLPASVFVVSCVWVGPCMVSVEFV